LAVRRISRSLLGCIAVWLLLPSISIARRLVLGLRGRLWVALLRVVTGRSTWWWVERRWTLALRRLVISSVLTWRGRWRGATLVILLILGVVGGVDGTEH
jgi:hypothetical protein